MNGMIEDRRLLIALATDMYTRRDGRDAARRHGRVVILKFASHYLEIAWEECPK